MSAPYQEIVKDELNVKEVKFDKNLNAYATKKLYLYTPLLGKTLGKDMGAVMAAYKQGTWQLNDDGTLNIAGLNLTPDLFEVRLEMKEGVAGLAFAENKAVITLDTTLTPTLLREGMARDFVRLVQTLRKQKDFNISDRITLCWQTNSVELQTALKENAAYIAEQVLAVQTSDVCQDGTKDTIDGQDIVFDVVVA